MKRLTYISPMLLLVAVLLGLAACSRPPLMSSDPDVKAAVEDGKDLGQSLVPYRSEELGLALDYLPGWRVVDSPQGVTFRGPPHGSGPEPPEAWLSINVRPAPADASLDQVVEAQLARYPDLASQIRRSEITLGGEPAAVLDGMPGRHTNRQIYVLHDDKLYEIIVTPIDDPNFADLQPEAEAIWQAVVDSWQFLPPEAK